MRTYVLSFVLAAAAASLAVDLQAQQPEWVGFRNFTYSGRDTVAETAPPKPTQFTNPVLAGYYPDPSILREGGQFYLVNSTFAYFPGIPIFQSSDLVHWKQLGHVLDRPSQLNLDGAGVSGGIFAPAIAHHDGLFYVIGTVVMAGETRNFFVTATNPAGPWSEPKRLPQIKGIDPSFFFDQDGKAYIVHNGKPQGRVRYVGHRALWIVPFDPAKGEVSGPERVLVDGGTDPSKQPFYIEGPHLYHRNGWYYLMAAEGGTEDNHSEVIFRSKTLDGTFEPWKGNPILTQRTLPPDRLDPVTNTGHADLVMLEDGSWWSVFLGSRPYKTPQGNGFYNLGRETFMLPVTWPDDWPIILPNGEQVSRVVTAPHLPKAAAAPQTGTFNWNDDFSKPALSPEWEMLRTPHETWWKSGNRELLLSPRSATLDGRENPSALLRRQQHNDFTASVDLDLATLHQSDAGLVAFQNDKHFFYLAVKAGPAPARQIVLMVSDGGEPHPAGTPIRIDSSNGMIGLRITMQADRYHFWWRQRAGGQWIEAAPDQNAPVLSKKIAGGFVGTMVGVFAHR